MENEKIRKNWTESVANRVGINDKAGGYSFGIVLAEEEALEKALEKRLRENNIPKCPSLAILKLSVADPVWKMLLKAMLASMKYYNKTPDATRYTDSTGIRVGSSNTNEVLAGIIAAQYQNFPQGFDGSWVQYLPDSIKGALAKTIPAAFFDEETLLVFLAPGYPVVKSLINRQGAKVLDIEMEQTKKGWRIPLEKIPAGKAKTWLYLNIPHNPTGKTCSREELTEIVDWANKFGIKLIVDEAYNDLRYDDSVSILEIPGWEQCCLVLRSVSKGYNATGLRFGYFIAHPAAIKALEKVTDVQSSGLFGPSIAAGLECLRHPEWAKETNQNYRELHKLLANGLKEAGFKGADMPEAGLCQFTRAPRSVDGRPFDSLVECVQYLRKKLGISVMHYEVGGKWYLRWAVTFRPIPEYGLPTEKAVIEELISRLKNAKLGF